MIEGKGAFWREKSLAEMNPQEWESLCDGCGRCCLRKLEDEDDGQIYYTHLSCQYLNQQNCRCKNYSERLKLKPDCLNLTPARLQEFRWLPASCAYRLLAEGEDLPQWHPLISGRAASVIEAGISVAGKTLDETYVHPDQWQDHIIPWIEL